MTDEVEEERKKDFEAISLQRKLYYVRESRADLQSQLEKLNLYEQELVEKWRAMQDV